MILFFFLNDPAPPKIYPLPRPRRSPDLAGGAGRARPRRATPAPAPPGGPRPPRPRGRGSPPGRRRAGPPRRERSEEHTSELQSRQYLVCRLLLEKKKKNDTTLSS